MIHFSRSPDHVFVLLDDATDVNASVLRRSRLYTGLLQTIDYIEGDSVTDFFASIENRLADGLHATGFFNYEFGQVLQQLPLTSATTTRLATVMLFERCEHLTAAEVENWLAEQATHASYAVEQIQASLSQEQFAEVFEDIHRYIEAGDAYQLNVTFPLTLRLRGDPVALYAALRERQPVPFGALACMPDGSYVLSLSPELFVSHQNGRLRCKPMKGTAKAQGDATSDALRSLELSQSIKERAENLMIVDLLRNDLGRIADTGSVTVCDLFAVERFGDVLQMTSSIEAQWKQGSGLAEFFSALYPCGSITGAPKRRAMQLLQSLEQGPRGLYTGAIGWFDPPAVGQAVGDFTLSVPIRTLLLDRADMGDWRQGVISVGAGITYDSDPQAEYQECLLKASFLTGLKPGFELFETLHATRTGIRHLDRHIARMSVSASYFGFRFDEAEIRHRLALACQQLSDTEAHRIRLSLSAFGRLDVIASDAPLRPLKEPVRLLVSNVTMHSSDHFLRHKTSLRSVYDKGWQDAEAVGAFDTLFCNEHGELTEGGRSNVFVRLGGRWFTPPLSAGLLPGVMRAVLMEDESLNITESSLTVADLHDAEEIRLCNALRGWILAKVFADSHIVSGRPKPCQSTRRST